MEQTAFKAELNGSAFDAVIKSQYSDVIRSPMREIASNAFDAHVAAGCPERPFEITLPSELNPIFSVRDYGVSMSHTEVMDLYSTLFWSSKRATNSMLGQKGLGSKTPLAYASSFTLQTYRDGVCRTYCVFLDNDGIPQTSLLSTNNSNQERGTCVSFAVNLQDVQTFRNVANEVYFGFDPKPIITNETFKWGEPEILYQGEGWKMYKQGTVPFSTMMARQGPVIYPVSRQQLRVVDCDPIYNWPILIDFPIGELSVSTSRESLNYDDRTIRNMLDRIEQTRKQMLVLVQDEINAAGSWIEACKVLYKGLRSSDLTRRSLWTMLKPVISYDGKGLTDTFHLPKAGNGFQVYHMHPDSMKMGVLKYSVSFRQSEFVPGYNAESFADKVRIYHEGEKVKFGPSRMRTVIKNNTDNKHILWVRGDISTIKSLVGDKEIIDLGSIETTKAPKRGESLDKVQTLRVTNPKAYYSAWSDSRAYYEEFTLGPDVVYIDQRGSVFDPWGTGERLMAYSELHNFIYGLKREGLFDNDQRFCLLPKKSQGLIEMYKLTPFAKYAEKKAREFLKKVPINGVEASGLTYNDEQKHRRFVQFMDENPDVPIPTSIKAWYDRLSMVLDESGRTRKLSYSMRDFLRRFNILQEVSFDETELGKLTANVEREYPLFFHLLPHWTLNPYHLKHYLELLAK